jgi:chromosome segregation ATPase
MQDKKGNTVDKQLEQETAAMQQVRELLFGAQIKEIQKQMQNQQAQLLLELNNTREDWQARLKALEKAMNSENAELHNKLQQEQAQRENVVQDEQREREENIQAERERLNALKIEQTELLESTRTELDVQREILKSELCEQLDNLKLDHDEQLEALRDAHREHIEDMAKLTKNLNASDKALDNKIAKLSEVLTATEKNIHEVMQTGNTTLSDRLEQCYHEALSVISTTAVELRRELVSRAFLSRLLNANVRELDADEAVDTARSGDNQ